MCRVLWIDKCTQTGVHDGKKVVFPKVDAPLRTDAAFDNMVDEDHHRGPNPFFGLSLKMITQFPLDYMHLVCLGVTKRLLCLYLSQRIQARVWSGISERLVGLHKSIPSEFARKPRPISEYLRWKATEFRQFLLYTGPVVLYNNIPEALYHNFILLSVGIRILCDSDLCVTKLHLAHLCLTSFVTHCFNLFGLGSMVYNVHGLVHLCEDVRKYGPLDNFSSFPYENYLGKLKKMVRKPTHVLEQIVLRLKEKCSLEKKQKNFADNQTLSCTNKILKLKNPHSSGQIACNSFSEKHSKIQFKQFFLTKRSPDNCFEIEGSIALVVDIMKSGSNVFVEYQIFQRIRPLFSYPINSFDLNICIVSSPAVKFHRIDVTEI